MTLPSCRVLNRPHGGYANQLFSVDIPEDGSPVSIDFPPLAVSMLEDVYCLPFAPPFILGSSEIITDYLIPWAPNVLGWFESCGNDSTYASLVDVDMSDLHADLEVGFYMDHSVPGHFAHFIADCLSRMWAWELSRSIFGELTVVLACSDPPLRFQEYLLAAAGVPEDRVLKLRGLVHCRKLLCATPSVGVQRYTSPTASRLFGTVRDRGAQRDISIPDRIYFSRRGVHDRRTLVNEAEVEEAFERRGFIIVRPETLPIREQLLLAANARLVAGCSGSGMFNLAFQGRMASAFVLVSEAYILMNELLLSAGRSCELRFHIGSRLTEVSSAESGSWRVDLKQLEDDVDRWLGDVDI